MREEKVNAEKAKAVCERVRAIDLVSEIINLPKYTSKHTHIRYFKSRTSHCFTQFTQKIIPRGNTALKSPVAEGRAGKFL